MSDVDSTTYLAGLLDSLPTHWQAPVEALANDTLHASTPLRLIVLGAFSVGKSSLLNMLLQESILQSALEESTALPTFIEYGATREMSLIGADGSQLPIDSDQFSQFTTQAPEGAACAVLNMPQAWLHGVSVIDLPGLGSTSVAHREYTLAQLQIADAVLYLLNPTGPSSSDADTLRLIRQSGKRVKVLVARWDEVEKAVAHGERQPSLEQWAAQIEQTSGLRVRLAPCHRDGLGREEIQDFVQRAREDLNQIRLQRFQAELKPLLENALGVNAEQQRSCQVDNEADARQWHETLISRKEQLALFKATLYTEQQQDSRRLSQEATTQLKHTETTLNQHLTQLREALTSETQWDTFGQQGTEAVHRATQQAAQMFSELSSNYGQLDLPAAQIAEFNLRLPEPETVSVDDFLDMGRLMQLQDSLASKEAESSTLETQLNNLHTADMSEHDAALLALQQQRQHTGAQALPMVTQTVGGGSGALFGRLLGEAMDIGVMMITPATAAAKAASLLGKGSKIASTVGTTVKVIQTAQKVRGGVMPAPLPVLDKLGHLEKLSFGYWGEQLFGGGAREIQTVDPQAIAERDAHLAAIDQQIHQLRSALARNEDIANERQLKGWALEQSQKERARLQQDIEQLRVTAAQKHQDAEQYLSENRQRQLQHHAERAVSLWLRAFEQNTSGMLELLRARIKTYWEERVDGLLNDRLHDIEQLHTQSQASAETRKATLLQLRSEAQLLENALASLS